MIDQIRKLLQKVHLKTLSADIGKEESQALFEQLHEFSLQGLNYGNGDRIGLSGEENALRYIKGKISDKPVLFDVGANKGQFATVLLDVFPTASIYSFEPSPRTYSELKKSMQGKKISLYPLGFSDVAGAVSLYSTPLISEISSVYQRRLDHIGVLMNDTETIELTTLDAFCKKHHVPSIDLLKMDIEGHELSALKGAKEMLDAKRIRFIQFEFGGTNIDSRTYFQDFWYLLSENYHIYRIVKDGLRIIPKYKETLEIFTTINYLAELKTNP